MKTTHTPQIMAGLFIALLAAFTLSTAWQFTLHNGTVLKPAENAIDWANGTKTSAIETSFEKDLPYKNTVTGIWGATQYGVFNTGAKGVVIGSDGWLFTEEEFALSPDYNTHLTHNLERIHKVAKILAAKNTHLVISVVPAKSHIHANELGKTKRPAAWESIHQATVLSLSTNTDTLFLRPAFEAHAGETLYMRTDTHWSPAGAKLAAQEIAAYIKKKYPTLTLPASKHSLEMTGQKAFEGDLMDFVPAGKLRFFVGPQSETLDEFQHKPTDAATAAGLFDEPEIAVALVGTSYSAEQQWHMEDFLKEAMHTDMLNLADEGTGPMEPMIEFLENQEKYPGIRLVIWEFPERYLPVDYSQLERTVSYLETL